LSRGPKGLFVWLLADDLDYEQALEAGARRLRDLPPAQLAIEIKVGGKIYRAITCKAGTDTNVKRLSSARLWESGRLVQHFDLEKLKFEDKAGVPLHCDGTLDLVAWPGSLTLNVELTPGGGSDQASDPVRSVNESETWTDAVLSVRLKSDLEDWHAEKRIAGAWKPGQRQRVTLTCNIPGTPIPDERVSVLVSSPGQIWPVTFTGGRNCMTAKVKGMRRTWKTGYTDTYRMSFNLPLDGVESSKWVLKQTTHAD